jgi:RNA polymerase sigma-70 factor (ECF subfamily)
MILRRRKGAPATLEASEELLDAVLASAPVQQDDVGEERLRALPSALDRLAAGQRRCLELFYLEGYSYAEVASRSGFALNEVKSHIQNGKRNLRMLLGGPTA